MEYLQEEEAPKRADGRRPRLTRQARQVKNRNDGKEPHIHLLIAETTQEILLGYNILRRHVENWGSEKGKVESVVEHPETVEEQGEGRLAVSQVLCR